MAKSLGTVATLYVSPDDVTYTRVGKVVKADFLPVNNPVDSTDNDDNGYKSNLYGDQQVKGACTANYDPLDAGQSIIDTNAVAKNPLFFKYRPRGDGTGLPQIKAQYVISDWYPMSEHEKTQQRELKCVSTGTVTQGVQ